VPRKKPPALLDACARCRFYKDAVPLPGGITRSGQCRRYPDTVPKDSTDWCGEFQARP